LTGLADDEDSLGWDNQVAFNPNSEWAEKVRSTIPHIEEDEMYYLRKMARELGQIAEHQGDTSSQATA